MKKKQPEFYCPKCGNINEPIKEQSNENWSVINPTCDKCGADNDIRIVIK